MRRRAYSLLEILIVLSVVAIIGSTIAINAYRALEQQRFYSSVEGLADRIRLAQDLMLIMHRDCRVELRPTPEGLYTQVLTEGKLPYGAAELAREVILKGISSMRFSNDRIQTNNGVTLEFLSNGSVMSYGEIQLQSVSGFAEGFKAQISLKGSPAPIQAEFVMSFKPYSAKANDQYVHFFPYPIEVQEFEQQKKQKQNEKKETNKETPIPPS